MYQTELFEADQKVNETRRALSSKQRDLDTYENEMKKNSDFYDAVFQAKNETQRKMIIESAKSHDPEWQKKIWAVEDAELDYKEALDIRDSWRVLAKA